MIPVQVKSTRRFIGERPASIDRHKPNSRFDQFAPNQITGPAMALPIEFASRRRFRRKVECIFDTGTGQRVKCL